MPAQARMQIELRESNTGRRPANLNNSGLGDKPHKEAISSTSESMKNDRNLDTLTCATIIALLSSLIHKAWLSRLRL
jgi:hypothetical protein